MMINPRSILDRLQTLASNTGHFSNINGHEPKSAPVHQDQVNLAFWGGPITPVASSGLDSVSWRWQIEARIFMSAESDPADDIEPAVVAATFAFLEKLTLDWGLGDRVRQVDIYGSEGEGVSATPGYYEYDGSTIRSMDIVIPVILNDVTVLGG